MQVQFCSAVFFAALACAALVEADRRVEKRQIERFIRVTETKDVEVPRLTATSSSSTSVQGVSVTVVSASGIDLFTTVTALNDTTLTVSEVISVNSGTFTLDQSSINFITSSGSVTYTDARIWGPVATCTILSVRSKLVVHTKNAGFPVTKVTTSAGVVFTEVSKLGGDAITLAESGAGTSFGGSVVTVATASAGSLVTQVTSSGGAAFTKVSQVGGDVITLAESGAGTVTSFGGSVFTVVKAAAGSLVTQVTSAGGAAFTEVSRVGGEVVTLAQSGAGVITSFGGSVYTVATAAQRNTENAAPASFAASTPLLTSLAATLAGILFGAWVAI